MKRLLVVGGLGFYGERVCRVLRQRGYEVVAGSRRAAGEGTLRIDLADPSTFDGFDGFDAVVNASDSVGAPCGAAIERVLRRGGVWFDMGASADAVERSFAAAVPDPRGTVLVGVGVFPGLSTALARAAAEARPRCGRCELVIRFSPLSGAGAANCRLMAESLFVPASRWQGGTLVASRLALGRSERFAFGGRPQRAVEVTLPDTALVRRATSAQSVSTSFVLVPGWLRWSFAALALLAYAPRAVRPALVWSLTWQLAAVRAILLRRVRSRVELLAVADRGTSDERSRTLAFEDGQEATALGVAAAVDAWALAGAPIPPGVHGIAEVFAPEVLLARWADLAAHPGLHT